MSYPPVTCTAVRHQLRSLAFVVNPAGKKVYFRYYDPRVLRVYLPTCQLDEIQTVFGPIIEILMEGENSNTLHRFHHSLQGSRAQLLKV